MFSENVVRTFSPLRTGGVKIPCRDSVEYSCMMEEMRNSHDLYSRR